MLNIMITCIEKQRNSTKASTLNYYMQPQHVAFMWRQLFVLKHESTNMQDCDCIYDVIILHENHVYVALCYVSVTVFSLHSSAVFLYLPCNGDMCS